MHRKKTPSKKAPARAIDSLKICFDRIIPDDYQPARSTSERVAMRAMGDPGLINPTGVLPIFRAAAIAIKKWPEDHLTLNCRFLDGDAKQRKKVEAKAHMWEQYANVKFKFVASGDAEIRISFTADAGSWSAVGTDALVEQYYPKYQPTMNYGWLKADTEDREYERIVLHEFGHALGLIHEHQNPSAKLRWNKVAVYHAFSGSPNYWDIEQINVNIFERYSSAIVTDTTRFDPDSIMLYMFPGELFLDGQGTKMNYTLSRLDKEFISKQYPFL